MRFLALALLVVVSGTGRGAAALEPLPALTGDEVRALYPPRPATERALELERLAAPLGLDLRPNV
jgi:hypothetical protein